MRNSFIFLPLTSLTLLAHQIFVYVTNVLNAMKLDGMEGWVGLNTLG